MKKIILVKVLLFGFYLSGFTTDKLTDIVRFASIELAKTLLVQEDKFTESWSQADINFRMQKANSTKEELLKYIQTQAREWTDDEKNTYLYP